MMTGKIRACCWEFQDPVVAYYSGRNELFRLVSADMSNWLFWPV